MKIVSKPIRMIAVFWPNKNPIPYKFKIQDEDGLMQTIKIDKILYSYTNRMAGIDSIIYECQSLIRGTDMRYELKYLIASCQWLLYKI